jgi:hypothetical protein
MRCMGNQLIGQLLLGFVRKVPGMGVAQAIHLPLDGFADCGVPVAQTADGSSPRRVEIPLAVGVVQK